MTTEKTSRICLAYDGSVNGDWVSRYAIRIAANSPNQKLFLLHILDTVYSPEEIRLKIKAIEDECAFQHVELGHAILPLNKNVLRTIQESIPRGRENFCICGCQGHQVRWPDAEQTHHQCCGRSTGRHSH